LFATQPPSVTTRLTTSADAGYNARAFEPIAGERLEPRASLIATLSPLLSVSGQLGAASTLDHRTRLSDQVELMVTPLRRGTFSLASAIGTRHEYTGTDVALGRVIAARTTGASAFAADALFEHPFASGRDALDVIFTVGATRALTQRLWLGAEAVGSDLEGFWSEEEAEGGATLLIGPTMGVVVSDRWRMIVGGGPVIRATTNKTLTGVETGSAFGTPNGQAGYVLRISARRSW
jgi:hypothetical protein